MNAIVKADIVTDVAFPDASLRLLSDTLPLNINSLTRYWLSVEPRV